MSIVAEPTVQANNPAATGTFKPKSPWPCREDGR